MISYHLGERPRAPQNAASPGSTACALPPAGTATAIAGPRDASAAAHSPPLSRADRSSFSLPATQPARSRQSPPGSSPSAAWTRESVSATYHVVVATLTPRRPVPHNLASSSLTAALARLSSPPSPQAYSHSTTLCHSAPKPLQRATSVAALAAATADEHTTAQRPLRLSRGRASQLRPLYHALSTTCSLLRAPKPLRYTPGPQAPTPRHPAALPTHALSTPHAIHVSRVLGAGSFEPSASAPPTTSARR